MSPHWPYGECNPLYTGAINGQPICLLQAPVGAPGTVMVMEELIACGTKVVIGLGWAGSLQPHAPVGSFLLPARCLREEGTSFHYYPDPAAELPPDAGLLEKLEQAALAEGVQPLAGPHWTTDAPYRETLAKLAAYRQQGILGVDMETSAMYALGCYRGVRVANLLVVSDELWQGWQPAFHTPELVQASKTALRVVERCIAAGGLV
jgi:uridine phosphorylase